jgi:hypothetical protein
MQLRFECLAQKPLREQIELPVPVPNNGAGSAPLLGPGCSLRECKISVSSDFQLYQKFNNLTAETTYVTTLWSFISDRYETQASTILTFPYVAFYTTSNDPWTTPDGPGSSTQMLNEFVAAWQGNIPSGGRIGHFMSGASLGGGIAYLDVLCNNNFGFGVSGNMNGTIASRSCRARTIGTSSCVRTKSATTSTRCTRTTTARRSISARLRSTSASARRSRCAPTRARS